MVKSSHTPKIATILGEFSSTPFSGPADSISCTDPAGSVFIIRATASSPGFFYHKSMLSDQRKVVNV